MKTILLLIFALCISLHSFSQVILDTTVYEKLDGQDVYLIVESWPKFAGGEKALEKFIQQNISGSLRKKDSKVFMSVIIDKYGFVREPKLLRGKDTAQVNESFRILKKMPRWIPGKYQGKIVYVRVPLKFDFNPR